MTASNKISIMMASHPPSPSHPHCQVLTSSSPARHAYPRKRRLRSVVHLFTVVCSVATVSSFSVSSSSSHFVTTRHRNGRMDRITSPCYVQPSASAVTRRRSTTTSKTTPVLTRLHATSTRNTNSNAKNNKPLTTTSHRFSSEEQLELLRQVGEMRRIQHVKKEMALLTPNLKPPTSAALAQACGYGDDTAEMQQAVDRGHAARELLVTSNMGLVNHVVQTILGNKSSTKSLAREDLIQEGAIGLARAVDRWNPEIGGKFSTYAYYWIRAGVLRGIAQRDEMVRVPEHMRTAISKLQRAAASLGMENVFTDQRWKEAQSAKALAEEAGLTPKQLEQAWQVQDRRRNMLSFESWMQQGKDVSASATDSSLVQSSSSSSSSSSSLDSSPMATVELQDLKSTLAKFLRPRELEALSWRYGLMNDSDHHREAQATKKKNDNSQRNYVAEAEQELFGSNDDRDPRLLPTQGKWGEAMSFVEVGKRMQVSAEYGRRLCHAALEKLRRAAREGSLIEPAFVF